LTQSCSAATFLATTAMLCENCWRGLINQWLNPLPSRRPARHPTKMPILQGATDEHSAWLCSVPSAWRIILGYPRGSCCSSSTGNNTPRAFKDSYDEIKKNWFPARLLVRPEFTIEKRAESLVLQKTQPWRLGSAVNRTRGGSRPFRSTQWKQWMIPISSKSAPTAASRGSATRDTAEWRRGDVRHDAWRRMPTTHVEPGAESLLQDIANAVWKARKIVVTSPLASLPIYRPSSRPWCPVPSFGQQHGDQ
jgi:hypothetical protein